MARASNTRKKRERALGAKPLSVRMFPDQLKALDAWIKAQPAPRPTRPEAIRRLVEEAGARAQHARAGGHKGAFKARELAGKELDQFLRGNSAVTDEQEKRKRALVKGPREFRDFRADQPKTKG
jgi:hypothetical protein